MSRLRTGTAAPQNRADRAEAKALTDEFETQRRKHGLLGDWEAELIIDVAQEDGVLSPVERGVIHEQLARGGFDHEGRTKLREYTTNGVGVDPTEPNLGWGTTAERYARFGTRAFVRERSARDIRQGELGDCYFEAPMAALAHASPAFVKQLVKSNGDGTFTVRLYERGARGPVAHEIKVDGDFPVDAQGKATYTQPVEGQLWPALVEKAYAKRKGGYGQIGQGGSAWNSFFALTGHDPREYAELNKRSTNRDSVFRSLRSALESGKAVVAATIAEKEKLPLSLDEGHEYTVMAMGGAGADRWIEVRNPYGLDNDESRATYGAATDSVVRLSFDAFFKYFDEAHVASLETPRPVASR